jgi:hypothetical protein
MDTRHPDTGRADIAQADTGQLTPDAWTLTEMRTGRPRHDSHPDIWATTTSRRPAGRRTVFLWRQRLRRFARKAIEEARSDRFKLTTVPSGKIPASRASTCERRRSASTWCSSGSALLIDNGRLQDVYFCMSGWRP